jgi:hypothetical protein
LYICNGSLTFCQLMFSLGQHQPLNYYFIVWWGSSGGRNKMSPWYWELIIYIIKVRHFIKQMFIYLVCLFVCLMVFKATLNNISAISWRSYILVKETGGSGENHRSVANHWHTLSHNVIHFAQIEIRTHNNSSDRHWRSRPRRPPLVRNDMDINEYERYSNITHIKVQKERFDCWFYISQSR